MSWEERVDHFFEQAERGANIWSGFFGSVGPKLQSVVTVSIAIILSPVLFICWLTGYISEWREDRETRVRD